MAQYRKRPRAKADSALMQNELRQNLATFDGPTGPNNVARIFLYFACLAGTIPNRIEQTCPLARFVLGILGIALATRLQPSAEALSIAFGVIVLVELSLASLFAAAPTLPSLPITHRLGA